ncbi:hypothetical protein BJ741DRAFT_588594 [Chytriomyces cf. hyalinus JEL632]|nr:hypothetical protein BJ741DRAFT_588594 [Chytriomyces cf. hyalinus JEL632]
MSMFALTVVGLTLPSLISQNSWRLGLDSPPLSPSFVNKSMLLRIGVTDSLQDMRIISPAYTLLTHMFHHQDFSHWFSNMYALVMITAAQKTPNSLAAFVNSSFVFFGGGISGVFAHIIYATIHKRRQDARNQSQRPILNSISDASNSLVESLNYALRSVTGNNELNINLSSLNPFKERTIILCGASAGVYALMGAEFVHLGIQLYTELKQLVRLNRRPYLDTAATYERKRIQNRIVSILSVAIGHLVTIASQVIAVSGLLANEGAVMKSAGDGYAIVPGSNANAQNQGLWQIEESVGYAAHVGGFLFGMAVELIREKLISQK